jgi:hypothetical protein
MSPFSVQARLYGLESKWPLQGKGHILRFRKKKNYSFILLIIGRIVGAVRISAFGMFLMLFA